MQGMLEIKCFEFGSFGTNCYVVSDEAGHVLLIDPACSNTYERQLLKDYITEKGGGELSILATHGHLDHLWGAKWATELWQTPVLMHAADIPMAKAMQTQYNMFGIHAVAEEFRIEDLQTSLIGKQLLASPMQILHTSGHTPGSVCFYFPDDNVLFSGDTLFHMGYGRTDLPGGDSRRMMESLKYLSTLPPGTRVLPGHGEFSNIS
jgi:glyoxylase-like metal-dependent hydrolase (beta-lactamase superfamily II)